MGDTLETISRAYAMNTGLDVQDRSFNWAGREYYGVPTDLPARSEKIDPGFQGIVSGALRGSGVIMALEETRLNFFTEARFQFRNRRGTNGRPGDLYGTKALDILERPWVNGHTGNLLARMILDADLAGNAYISYRPSGNLRRMRPDWVTILVGVEGDPRATAADLDAEILGYTYWPGGFASKQDPVFLLPEEVAHFAPLPDPDYNFKGMSWVSSILAEVEGDQATTLHKLNFFRNGASLQTIATMDPSVPEESVRRFAAGFNDRHQGVGNAYKTLFLGGGADVKTVGATMQQLDFRTTQEAGETRMAAAARIPPAIAGLAHSHSSSNLNAGDFSVAKRLLADGTMRPLWRDACGSLSVLVAVPGGSELWYDARDIAWLQEDILNDAKVMQTKAITSQALINSGFKPDTVVKAVEANDMTLLQHTGLYSVQLQPPMLEGPKPDMPQDPNAIDSTADVPAVPAGKAKP